MSFDFLRTILVAICALAIASPGNAAAASDDLGDMSLDQLMGITVTSASKKSENADEVSSAIFVLTGEDIRRSGALSVPEALRLVPGLEVARLNSGGWSITSRGFSGRFSTKVLVLMDGRSVYTPLFAGVYWDVQDAVLEDIDRIEVIRGPGATVWGANAVNGVINIITKKAEETQGLMTSVAAGNEERVNASLRWGGAVGDDLHYRAYAKYFNRDESSTGTGSPSNDDLDVGRVGVRFDWNATEKDLVTIQGDFYDGENGMDFTGLTGPSPITTRFVEDQEIQGGNVIARWSHTFSEEMDASVQFYYDRTDRTTPLLDEVRDTLDIEFQHRVELPLSQELIWGGGYRYTQDRIDNTFAFNMVPDQRHDDTFSFFIQDEIKFWEDKIRLTFGTKVENNDYTGWEYQPSVRVAVLPTENHTFWGAVSRAVRVPARANDDALLNVSFIPNGFGPCILGLAPAGSGCLSQAVGTPSSISERLYAFELGWRARFFDRITLDVAAFYNDYDDLVDVTAGAMGGGFDPALGFVVVTQDLVLTNGTNTTTHGVEADIRADLTDWWRLIFGYTYLHHRDANVLTPSHQGVIRSQIDLPFNLELDATLHLVGNFRTHATSEITLAASTVAIESYERVDLRLGWNPTESLEISLVGQNLSDNRHLEYPGELGIATSFVQRSYFAKVRWDY